MHNTSRVQLWSEVGKACRQQTATSNTFCLNLLYKLCRPTWSMIFYTFFEPRFPHYFHCAILNCLSLPCSKSCLRGWRLLTLLCCWFTCSDILKPFLLTYLQQNGSDPSRTYHHAASTCLIALRKTLKHGGRRNVPTSDEILAITVRIVTSGVCQ